MRKLTSAAFGCLAFAILAPFGSVASADGTPLTISLSPASDTGVSSSDRITNDRTPTLIGTAPPRSVVGIVTTESFDTFIAKTVSGADGKWSVTLPEQDGGSRYYAAEAGGRSTKYLEVNIRLYVDSPDLYLDSSVDRLPSSDGIVTAQTHLTLEGYVIPDFVNRVVILKNDKAVADANAPYGDWRVTLPSLDPGTYTFTAVAQDVAGNTSEPSDPLVVTIVPKSRVLSLSNIRGSAGFTITGASSSGIGAGPAGDVNGDGIEDLLLPGAVIFGSKERRASVLPLKSLNGKNGFTITSCYGDYGATAVGDFNGDGFDDIGVGCEFEDGDRLRDAGGAYVIFGHSGPFPETVRVTQLDEGAGLRIAGSQRLGRLGASVSGGGDVNGDGFDDFIIGAPGEAPAAGPRRAGAVYVLFGKAGGFPAELSAATLAAPDGFRINGVNHNEMLGSAIAAGADLNADGVDDIVLGPLADGWSRADRAGYVMFGAKTAFPSVIAASALSGTKGFRVGGLPRTHDFGFRISVGGDVNGDGIDDVLFGAQYRNSYAYVILGRRRPFPSYVNVTKLNGLDGFSVVAPSADEIRSDDMAIVGDLNGDGAAELAMGLPMNSFQGSQDQPEGAAIIAYGRKSRRIGDMNLSLLPPEKGFRIDGAEEGDDAGRCVAGVGDINGDGFGDMAICSTFGRRNIGTVTILYGGRNR